MPSDRPKVTAYITPETSKALDAAAKAIGQSRSRLVGDLIDSAVPVLRVITEAALVVKSAPGMQREALAGLAEQISPMQGQSDALLADLMAAIGKGQPTP